MDILQVVLTTLDDKMCREVKISPQPRQKLPQTLWKYARTIGNQTEEDRQKHRYHRYHRKSTYIGTTVQNLKKLPDMRIIAHHNVKSFCGS